MLDQNLNGSPPAFGSEKSEIIPAALLPNKTSVNTVMLRSGFGKLTASPTTLDPAALLKSFRRRWSLALGLGIVAAVVVGVVALLVVPPVKYTTRSALKVSMHRPRVMFETQEQMTDYRTFQNTQTQMIKSSYVLSPALQNPKVAELPVVVKQVDPTEWLESQIQVGFAGGAEILSVSMSSANPDELVPIVNAVVESYLQTVVQNEHLARISRLEQLKALYARFQEELKTKRGSVRELSNKVGSVDRMTLVMIQGFQLEDLNNLQKELLEMRAKIRTYQGYISRIEANLEQEKKAPATPPKQARPAATAGNSLAFDGAVELEFDSDPQKLALEGQLETLGRKYKKLRELARSSADPAANAISAEMRIVRANLAARKERIKKAMIARRDQPGRDGESEVSMASNLATLRDRMAILKSTEVSLMAEVDKHREAIAKLNEQTIDLQNELDDIGVTSTTSTSVAKEISALDVELKAPPRIEKLYPAEPPRKKDAVKRYLICGGAAFGALALAMLSVSFWEMRAMRIDSVDEVVNNLGLSLVGALPALPNRSAKLSKADDQRWQGLLVESIDATRTMLLHASRVTSTRAVMITSAMKGEGKTSLAAHLATSLARAGRKTLLIDCDLRRPRLHQLFDVARLPGLCELLRGEAEVNDVIRPTPADDLNMIPAGHCDGIALQAIAQDGFREILTILKKRYDFIIIDSAPVLPVVDTMLLSQQVDAVLFSIMRDVSRVPHVHAAHERLASLGVKMLGAVVSAAERKDYMHMYDYEYQSVEAS